jgi:anti-sigma-K factor RskA
MNGQDRMMTHRDEMETLLPFYLNGTLEGAELAAVEEWLGSDPEAAAALERAEAEFSATSAANEAIRPPVDALSRFSKALEEVAGPAPAASAPSLLAGLWHRFMDIPAAVAWGAAAAAFALLVVQAVVSPGDRARDFELAGAGDTV